MSAVVARPAADRPSGFALIWAQTRHANANFWRTPIAAFFALVFPLMFLVLLAMVTGNAVIDPSTGRRYAQFLTPAMAVFGTTAATFVTVAIAVTADRESGVLRRVRGTPLPAWALIGGRVLSAAWVAVVAVLVLTTVGVAAYGVEIVWAKVPAALLTLALGVACLACLGLAVAARIGRVETAGAVTNALFVPLSFVSGIFTPGELPVWLSRLADLFPLKHFFLAFSETFNPYLPGAGLAWEHLGVMAAWGAAGAVVALRVFQWEPRSRAGGPATGHANLDEAVVLRLDGAHVTEAPRPRLWTLLGAQFRHALVALWRSPATVGFSLGLPLLLVMLLPQVFGVDVFVEESGVPLPQHLTPVLAVYGMAVAAYGNLGQSVSWAREAGVLKRVHGTPLPVWAYVGGQVGAAMATALVALSGAIVAGTLLYDVTVVWAKLPALVVYAALGIACLAALGVALASMASSSTAAATLTNATLLPLAFVSDIFLVGELPRWLEITGWVFPLKPLANGVAGTFNPTVPGGGWHAGYLAALTAWLIVALLVATRGFTWQPAREHGHRWARARVARPGRPAHRAGPSRPTGR